MVIYVYKIFNYLTNNVYKFLVERLAKNIFDLRCLKIFFYSLNHFFGGVVVKNG